uniref:YeeE/YedE family protein n=1 Tax=Thaumasiovibrio occultus TaxID=1891184 RepID=UPI000B34CEDE|nr:YeeE/YedE thiosulfate transporter family protein [Thaumasiovibrio occultus]
MDFTIPWHALYGGMLLGVSASLLLLFNGRIAGISGIVGGIIQPDSGGLVWRVLFVGGMIGAGLVANQFGVHFPLFPSDANLDVTNVVAAGLLVGMGTKMGNGCTSGHGICGIGRLSKRSFAATCTFMAVAMITVFIRLHLL